MVLLLIGFECIFLQALRIKQMTFGVTTLASR